MAKWVKTSDKDIKAFFNDYMRAEIRIKVITRKIFGGDLVDNCEIEERDKLYALIKIFDGILAQFSDLEEKVIRKYYIEKRELLDISIELNYNYEYLSLVKNKACGELRLILNTPADQLFDTECIKKIWAEVRDENSFTDKTSR